ncbi:MAG TPA: retropepsin-like aspartic protease [Rhabdochlamydiaceae bacterium]
MNSAQPEHEDSQEEEEKDTRKTSAYAFGSIENTPTEFVVDTGAGGCMIAKDYLDHLGYAIEKPTKLTFITVTGVRVVSLGKVHEIPVKLGDITVPMDMVVVQTTTYEVILRTEWLDKVYVVIDFNA